jgi:hypothetical protein
MTLEEIFWSFISWEMLVCVIVWIASAVSMFYIVFFDDGEKNPGATSDIYKYATLNAIFVLLLMKL